jgi:hypothetical protein
MEFGGRGDSNLTSPQPPADDEIKPNADDLLVFIDDTGHETFAGNQGFYGLGAALSSAWAMPISRRSGARSER